MRSSLRHPTSSVPWPLDGEQDPRRWLFIGVDDSGGALELVLLVFDGGSGLIIHAVKARAQFLGGH